MVKIVSIHYENHSTYQYNFHKENVSSLRIEAEAAEIKIRDDASACEMKKAGRAKVYHLTSKGEKYVSNLRLFRENIRERMLAVSMGRDLLKPLNHPISIFSKVHNHSWALAKE